MRAFVFIILFCISTLCSAVEDRGPKQIAESLFKVYQQRTDFDKFLSFYDDNLVFEDVFYKVNLTSKQQFAEFYDWHSGHFNRLDNDVILTIDSLIAENNTVIAKGTFLPFKFNNKKMGPWSFIIWLEFNAEGKVIKQQDWINYTEKPDS